MAQGSSATAAEQAYQDALRLQQGAGGKADPAAVAEALQRAVVLLQPAAERQEPEAMASLGHLRATASGDLAQRDEGLRLLRAAAAAHVPAAEYWLGELLAFGGDGIRAEPEEGRKWLMQAASRKDTRAALGLARVYRDGVGVKADWNEAAKWAQGAYRNGDWAGAVFIGRMLHKGGPNMDKDINEALKFYKRAYGEGHVQALTAIRELLPYRTSNELMALADEAARALSSRVMIGASSDNSRRYVLELSKIINVQADLQPNGNMHLTVQASDVELLKAFYLRYVVRGLHELKHHEAWLITRTQVLN